MISLLKNGNRLVLDITIQVHFPLSYLSVICFNTSYLIFPTLQQKCRAAPAPVVGWPPIRSFRKNLSSSSVKPSVGLENDNVEIKQKFDNNKKGLLVKINMDGIPIGRKVDLKAYDNYEKLSLGVKELFLGLLAGISDRMVKQ